LTKIEYQTLIFPPNLVYSLEDFKAAVKSREKEWKNGLANVLKICEDRALYEYCAIILREINKQERIDNV
jgi:hypothetical protein